MERDVHESEENTGLESVGKNNYRNRLVVPQHCKTILRAGMTAKAENNWSTG